jgi:UPF0755 protein
MAARRAQRAVGASAARAGGTGFGAGRGARGGSAGRVEEASSAGAAPRRSPRPSRARSAGPRAPAASKRPPWLLPAVAAAVFALLGAASWVGLYLVRPHHGRGVAVRVAMPEEHSADAIAAALARAGVVDHPGLFAWLLALTGAADRAPRGAVALRDDLTPRAVLRALAAGTGLVRVTIPEGYTRFEVARRLAEQGVIRSADEFVARTRDPAVLRRYDVRGDSLEGYLYPDTYDLGPQSSVDDVIDRLVTTFRRRLAVLRERHAAGFARAAERGLDERGVITLASLVEQETGAAEDRPRVAAVFWNRLTLPGFEPRVLQSDPTIVYGCRLAHPPSCADAPSTGRVAITRAMLDDAANAYNSYRHAGLPPGPIANPGARALLAVLEPADTRDLYFVAMGGGRSAFAATMAEHEANVQRYLRAGPRGAGAGDAGRAVSP